MNRSAEPNALRGLRTTSVSPGQERRSSSSFTKGPFARVQQVQQLARSQRSSHLIHSLTQIERGNAATRAFLFADIAAMPVQTIAQLEHVVEHEVRLESGLHVDAATRIQCEAMHGGFGSFNLAEAPELSSPVSSPSVNMNPHFVTSDSFQERKQLALCLATPQSFEEVPARMTVVPSRLATRTGAVAAYHLQEECVNNCADRWIDW